MITGYGDTAKDSRSYPMKLTDQVISEATIAPGRTSRALTDGRRLFLRITPSGKQWRLKIGAGKDETMRVLGDYPGVTITEARERAARVRQEARTKPTAPTRQRPYRLWRLADGDQASEKIPTGIPLKAAPAQVPTFKEVADRWLAKTATLKSGKPRTQGTLNQHLLALRHLKPIHGKLVTSIDRIVCRELVESIEARGTLPLASRALAIMTRIFDFYGDRDDKTFENPCARTANWLSGHEVKHHPAIVKPAEFAKLAEDIDFWVPENARVRHGPAVIAALKFVLRVPVRQRNVCEAMWGEFHDLDVPTKARWEIPGLKMKMREPFTVPLSRQAVAILLGQRGERSPPPGEYVFPAGSNASKRGKGHLSHYAMSLALKTMGYAGRHSPHGCRSSFSTLAHEADKDHRLIEMCLAHEVDGTVSASYNSATQIGARRALLQWWADYIEELQRA